MKNVFWLVLAAVLLAGCSGGSELHESMEEMGDSFKSMNKADSLEDIQSELEEFSANIAIAKQQQVKPEHQQDFDEGMEQLSTQLTDLETAVQAGDLAGAKSALAVLRDTNKKYHKKLGVEKR